MEKLNGARGPTSAGLLAEVIFLMELVSSIIVKVHSLLQFQLVIPHQDMQSKHYRDKVDRYRAGYVDI